MNKIIKKLGHCPLASLQSLDEKRLRSRVIYVTNQNLGRFYKIEEGNIKRNCMKALHESNVLGFWVFFFIYFYFFGVFYFFKFFDFFSFFIFFQFVLIFFFQFSLFFSSFGIFFFFFDFFSFLFFSVF